MRYFDTVQKTASFILFLCYVLGFFCNILKELCFNYKIVTEMNVYMLKVFNKLLILSRQRLEPFTLTHSLFSDCDSFSLPHKVKSVPSVSLHSHTQVLTEMFSLYMSPLL